MILQKDFSFGGSLVTVNEVDITPDLKQAHVFVGIIGSSEDKKKIVEELTSKRGLIQDHIGRRVTLKYTPQLHFRLDESVERGVRIISLMDEIEIPAEDTPSQEMPRSDD